MAEAASRRHSLHGAAPPPPPPPPNQATLRRRDARPQALQTRKLTRKVVHSSPPPPITCAISSSSGSATPARRTTAGRVDTFGCSTWRRKVADAGFAGCTRMRELEGERGSWASSHAAMRQKVQISPIITVWKDKLSREAFRRAVSRRPATLQLAESSIGSQQVRYSAHVQVETRIRADQPLRNLASEIVAILVFTQPTSPRCRPRAEPRPVRLPGLVKSISASLPCSLPRLLQSPRPRRVCLEPAVMRGRR